MLQYLATNPILFMGWFIALIIAISCHEFAHAYAADRLGDPTPRAQGRLTLNPLAHLDPVGTLMILLVRFGWGRPVQFDPFNLENPRRDAAVISLAGPASNLILATAAALALRILSSSSVFTNLLTPLILLNVILAVFNLLPVHPLDGFKIVGGLLPHDQYLEWQELQNYGIVILLFLLLPIFPGGSLISSLIGPPINFLLHLLLPSPSFI